MDDHWIARILPHVRHSSATLSEMEVCALLRGAKLKNVLTVESVRGEDGVSKRADGAVTSGHWRDVAALCNVSEHFSGRVGWTCA